MPLTPAEIFAQAKAAGDAAVAGGVDGYPCGFASINIKPARGPFVAWLKSAGIGRPDSYLGGYGLSSYDACAFHGQNVDVKIRGVDAFAKVLRDNGINCTTSSRWD